MKILIHVTKEMYKRAMMCGTSTNPNMLISENCAIALAVREIAPEAKVTGSEIIWSFYDSGLPELYSHLPEQAKQMIQIFDSTSPMKRLDLPEFSFEVDFPDALVEKIGIEEVKAILEKSETLEAV